MIKLLKNRNALIFVLSRVLSRFGDSLESLALMYLVYDLTGSAVAMGTVMLFSMIPNFLISPIAGVIADRYSKKRIMFIAEMVRAGAIILIPVLMFSGTIQLWHIYSMAVLVSVAESFFEPCANIVFVSIVDKEELHLVNSVSTVLGRIAGILGYSLAGLLIVFVNKEVLFIFDSITFLLSGVAVLVIKLPKSQEKKIGKALEIISDFKEGVKYIFTTKLIPILFLGILILSALLVPLERFVPVAVDQIFSLSPTWAGIFMTTLTIGSIVGGILYPILVKKNIKLKNAYLYNLVLLGVVILISCYIKSQYILFIMFFSVGAISSIIGSWSFTEIQKSCDERYLGRVGSVATMVMLAAAPLASFLSGVLIEAFSLINVWKLAGLLFIVVGLFMYIKISKLHEIKSEIIEFSEPVADN
ncbi:MFS transporter [Clostridium tunisiense]|uniref:MFS transporter n=1 Tax=Clostridium tunisiense TaxID=219748 RepID=UPI000308A283|nr:MFS transporter [Clostridium tunisiense]